MNRNRVLVSFLIALFCSACGGGGSSRPDIGAGSGGAGGGSGGGSPPAGGGGGGTGTPPGGGTTPTGVELEGGVSGTGLNFGPVDGFSSVIVNGIAMDVNSASVFVEGQAATQADLQIGQTVSIIGDLSSAVAEDLRYRSDVKGPITTFTLIDPLIGAATLTLLGQSVRTDAATRFDGTAIDALLVGDTLEVSGQRNATGELVASYITLIPASGDLKVTGNPTNITADTFDLDGLSVNYSNATLENFGGNSITASDRIEVRADVTGFSTPDTLTASAVERLPVLTINDDAELELEGFINSFTSSDNFSVNGQAVQTTSNTLFEFGDSELLGLNVKIEVDGTVDSSGVLVAESISIQPTEAIRVEGPIAGIDLNAGQVTALGLTFQVTVLTELEDDSSAAVDPIDLGDLLPGDRIEARGFLQGSDLVAAEIEREDADPEARLRAPVLAADASAGTLDLFGVRVTAGASTSYEDADGNSIDQSSFFAQAGNGVFVEARWANFSDTSNLVDQLSIEEHD